MAAKARFPGAWACSDQLFRRFAHVTCFRNIQERCKQAAACPLRRRASSKISQVERPNQLSFGTLGLGQTFRCHHIVLVFLFTCNASIGECNLFVLQCVSVPVFVRISYLLQYCYHRSVSLRKSVAQLENHDGQTIFLPVSSLSI